MEPKLSVGVLEVGFGNLPSLARVLSQLNVELLNVSDSKSLVQADYLIIPGVGSFRTAMDRVNGSRLTDSIRYRCITLAKPTLGICLGAQILLQEGLEGGRQIGVGVFEGRVVDSRRYLENKNPHNGWDVVQVSKSVLGFEQNSKLDAYFNHDFFFYDTDPADVCAVTNHGGEFPVILRKNETYALQFHPEKSQTAGLKMIKEFLRIKEDV